MLLYAKKEVVHMVKKLKFEWRLFRRQFHPLCGINIIHMTDSKGNYEMSYLTFLKTPMGTESVFRIGFDKNTVKKEALPNWIKHMLEG